MRPTLAGCTGLPSGVSLPNPRCVRLLWSYARYAESLRVLPRTRRAAHHLRGKDFDPGSAARRRPKPPPGADLLEARVIGDPRPYHPVEDLRVAQHLRRIDAGRAARGDPSGKRADHRQDQCCRNERHRIARRQSEEQRFNESRRP
jgi:hypothetical protein